MSPAASPLPLSSEMRVPNWNFAKCLAFRFICTYLVLFHADWVLPAIVRKSGRDFLYRRPFRALSQWVAAHAFCLDPAAVKRGWGGNIDTPLYYIHVLDLLVIAAIVAALWSLLDRKRPDYRVVYSWTRILVRYSLAFNLFTYGFAKVFVTQMAPMWLYLSRLVQPFGDKSPAGLLWAFVGYSEPY